MVEVLSMVPGSRAVQAGNALRKLTVAPSTAHRSASASSPITPSTTGSPCNNGRNSLGHVLLRTP